MTETKYDSLLRDFLERERRDRDEGNTIANLRLELHQLQLDTNEIGAQVRVHGIRLDRHGRDIRALKQQVFQRVEDDIDTGVHQVEDLKRHLAAKEAELRDQRDSVWWRRKRWEWAAAAVGAVMLLALGAVGTVLWTIITRGVGK